MPHNHSWLYLGIFELVTKCLELLLPDAAEARRLGYPTLPQRVPILLRDLTQNFEIKMRL